MLRYASHPEYKCKSALVFFSLQKQLFRHILLWTSHIPVQVYSCRLTYEPRISLTSFSSHLFIQSPLTNHRAARWWEVKEAFLFPFTAICLFASEFQWVIPVLREKRSLSSSTILFISHSPVVFHLLILQNLKCLTFPSLESCPTSLIICLPFPTLLSSDEFSFIYLFIHWDRI